MIIPRSKLEINTIRKIAWRIVPLFAIAYFFASLDRVNVGFAALQMNDDIGLSTTDFGFGAGLFFASYCLFTAFGNMLMLKLGATRWLSSLMIAWGVISACMSMVQGPVSFYILRFFLGVAESGFFPGVIYYFTLCFPARYRGRMIAILMIALPVSSVLGSPLSAILLNTDGMLGLKGWHWLFIIEGLPTVLLGLLSIVLIPKDISQAYWLSHEQQLWINAEILQDHVDSEHTNQINLFSALFHPRVLLLTLIYLGGTSVTNGLALWQPQLLKVFSLTTLQIGMLNSIPFVIASAAMYAWSKHSDKHNERRIHILLPLIISGLGLATSMYINHLWSTIIVLCIVISGSSMIKGPFWAMAGELLPTRISATSIGLINALTNLGIFVSVWLVGIIRTNTGNFAYAFIPLFIITLFACIAIICTGRKKLS